MTTNSPLAPPFPEPGPSTAASKVKGPRVGNDAIALMKKFCETTTKKPSPEQCKALLEQIHAMPGVGNQTYTLNKLREWFKRQRSPPKPRAPSTSAPPPAPEPEDERNPAYPSLTLQARGLLNGLFEVTEPEDRLRLFKSWIKSPFYSELKATEDDIRAWLTERVAREAGENNARINNASTDMDVDPDPNADASSNPLRVDTAVADAYAYGMPTPSDTTSPEPQWRERERDAPGPGPRYHPYAYNYQPPTPAPSISSSRAPSLALKSEPAVSPVVSTLSSLPPYVPPSPISASSSVVPLPPIRPRTQSPPPPEEPSIGLQILMAVKREMDEDKSAPPVPKTLALAELNELFAPWEVKMKTLFENLKHVAQWEPPPAQG